MGTDAVRGEFVVNTMKNAENISGFAKNRHTMSRIIDKSPGRGTFVFSTKPRIAGHFAVVGRKEADGPLCGRFDEVLDDCANGEDSYEKAECSMFIRSIEGALERAAIGERDVDLLIGGDLLNQIVSTNYAARCFDVPFAGVYNACATSCEAFALGAVLIDGGYCRNVACCTGSHFAAAERQYRGPLELGGQKAPYSQSTVTGCGCCILSESGSGVAVTQATLGKVIDYGVVDATNMGAAMAPGLKELLLRHFENTRTGPDDYDLIVSGDLGKLGSDILRELMRDEGIELPRYMDCGHMIYAHGQKMQQGGSGAGCSMSALSALFLPQLEKGTYKRILFAATGALMNMTLNQQGESIPAIAHAVVLEG